MPSYLMEIVKKILCSPSVVVVFLGWGWGVHSMDLNGNISMYGHLLKNFANFLSQGQEHLKKIYKNTLRCYNTSHI